MHQLFQFFLLFLISLLSHGQTNNVYQSIVVLSNLKQGFTPANTVEYLGIISQVDLRKCFEGCNLSILCRTFVYDSSSGDCQFYEGLVETGTIVTSSNPGSVVGDIDYSTQLFTEYGETCDRCVMNRYLQCSPNSLTCECPPHTFWNSSICQNQLYYGSNCSTDNWCREDLLLSCVNSTCQCPSNAFWNGATCQTVCGSGQTLITFDDIPGINSASFGSVPNGYKNLNWTNTFFVNADVSPYYGTGYWAARGSLSYVAAMQNSTPFSFSSTSGGKISLYCFEASVIWRDQVSVTLVMINGTFLTTQPLGTFNYWVALLYPMNFQNVDLFEISTSGGIPLENLAQNGTDIAFDNLCISYS